MLSFDKRKLMTGSLIALATALVVNLGYYLGLFEELELKMFDVRARTFSAKKPAPDDVAVILIDETSLRAMNPIVGGWPWPRSIHADIIDFLVLGGAKATLFDILFTENERIPGKASGTVGPNDVMLSDATESAGNVYHAAQLLVDVEDEYNKALLNKPLPSDFVKKFSAKKIQGMPAGENNTYYIPFNKLYKSSKGTGIVEFAADRDGVYRRTRLFRHYQGGFYPVMPMAPLLDIMEPENIKVEGNKLVLSPSPKSAPIGKGGKGESHDSRLTSNVSIPLQEDGSYLINMYGDFKPYSMSGILASIQKIKRGELENLPVDPEELKNKVVFIGASAVGVEDLKATSVSSKTPGVYLHASVYGNILKNDFLKRAPRAVTYLSVFVLSSTIAFVVLGIRTFVYQTGFPVVLASFYIAIALWLFKNNMVIDMVAPVATIGLAWMGSFTYLSFTEGKEKKKIKRMLGQYVSPAILTSVLEKSSKDILKAEVGTRERLTVLFSDIRGFTSMSEALEAEKVVETLNGYLSGMVDVIFKHEGTLDKFIGDAIMAFWGAPIKLEEHAKKAVEAAVEMKRQLAVFNRSLEVRGEPFLSIGVGINTGEMILGNIGSEKKLDYTIIGDNVNLASRMEGLTKEYGCSILVTETTYEDIKKDIPCRIVDLARVKGKKNPVRIYEPLAIPSDPVDAVQRGREMERAAQEAFDLYLGRKWEKATEAYSTIERSSPGDEVCNIFISRCREYMAEDPPADWDGVHVMLKK